MTDRQAEFTQESGVLPGSNLENDPIRNLNSSTMVLIHLRLHWGQNTLHPSCWVENDRSIITAQFDTCSDGGFQGRDMLG